MLGGIYAEYICEKSGLDKTLPASSADPELIFKAIQDLFFRVIHEPKPAIYAKHCEPVDHCGREMMFGISRRFLKHWRHFTH